MMRKIIWIPLILIIISCITPQPTGFVSMKEKIYVDQDGNKITEGEFEQKWRDRNNNLVPYEYEDKSAGQVVNVLNPLYSRYMVKYPEFSQKIEEITGKKFPGNTVFLIEYIYVNERCSTNSTNKWLKHVINKRKQFTTPNKRSIEKRIPEIVVLNFFEMGIILKNSPDSKKEYYYQDLDNFLRSAIFLHPSHCGSFALVKPNGETLVRNGESSSDYTAQHLQPEIWEQIFPPGE